MAEEDTPVTNTNTARCFDKELLTQTKHQATRQARKTGPPDQGDPNHHIDHAFAQRGSHGNRQYQRRHGEKDVGDAHQEIINPATGITRRRPNRNTNHRCEHNNHGPNLQRQARAH